MTARDTIGQVVNLSAGAYGTMQPSGSIAWLVQNIAYTGPYELLFNKNGINITCATSTASGWQFWNNLTLHNTSDGCYVMLSTGSAASGFQYNGIVENDGTNGTIVVSDAQNIAAGAYLTIQPPAGQEYQLHSVMSNGNYSIVWGIDGTASKGILTGTAGNWNGGLHLMLTHDNHIMVQNTSSTTQAMGFTGVRTK